VKQLQRAIYRESERPKLADWSCLCTDQTSEEAARWVIQVIDLGSRQRARGSSTLHARDRYRCLLLRSA